MGGKVVTYRFEGGKRRKLGKQIRGGNLINMFRADYILQTAFPHIAQFCLVGVRESVFYQIVRGLRKKNLSAVAGRHNSLSQCQGCIPWVAWFIWMNFQLCSAGMDSHSHFDWCRRPWFVLQQALCIQRGIQCLTGCIKRHRKRVANDSKDKTVVSLHGFP